MTNPVTHIISHVRDWITGEDISRLHDEAVHHSIMRYSRGNTAIQAGRYMTQEDLDKLRAKGDKAHRRIKADA